jgi:hypothetical protein
LQAVASLDVENMPDAHGVHKASSAVPEPATKPWPLSHELIEYSSHTLVELRKWLEMQLLHVPSNASHAAHPPDAEVLEAQQRLPTQAALTHQSFAEHDAPADWLFFVLHVESVGLRKCVERQKMHLPFDASHASHPVAYELEAQHRSPTQEALAQLALDVHDSPASFFTSHVESVLSRKCVERQVPHLPFDASHAEHPVAYELEAQHRLPTHCALVHQSFAEHDAPAGWLFFALQVESVGLRKCVGGHALHLPATQAALMHQSFAEHDAPGALFAWQPAVALVGAPRYVLGWISPAGHTTALVHDVCRPLTSL